jgi:hypothetical protein
MGTITILYAVVFSYFFSGFQEFLHKYLLYTSSNFPTEIFKDNIHSTWSSSVQGEVIQYICVSTWLRHEASKCQVDASPGAPLTEPPRLYTVVTPMGDCLICIREKECMNENQVLVSISVSQISHNREFGIWFWVWYNNWWEKWVRRGWNSV